MVWSFQAVCPCVGECPGKAGLLREGAAPVLSCLGEPDGSLIDGFDCTQG